MLKEIASSQPVNIQQITEKRRGTIGRISPVGFIAQLMLDEACEAQRDISRLLNDNSSTTHRPTWKDMQKSLSHEKRNLFLVSCCAIAFASLLPELELTLVEGQFSTENFYGRYNHAIMGTLLPKWDKPEAPTEAIPEFSRARMLARVTADKTFSNFFHGPGVLDLPKTARDKLEEEQLLQPIDDHIVPAYYNIARILIRPNEDYGRK